MVFTSPAATPSGLAGETAVVVGRLDHPDLDLDRIRAPVRDPHQPGDTSSNPAKSCSSCWTLRRR